MSILAIDCLKKNATPLEIIDETGDWLNPAQTVPEWSIAIIDGALPGSVSKKARVGRPVVRIAISKI